MVVDNLLKLKSLENQYFSDFNQICLKNYFVNFKTHFVLTNRNNGIENVLPSMEVIYNIGDAINKIGFGLVVYTLAVSKD